MGDYYKEAITIDPNYALAYAGLANYYGIMAARGTSGAEYWPKSEEAAVKALALDESSGEAHETLAAVRMWYDRNWRGTESELKRAIELKPEFVEAYLLYARLLGAMGRFDEAIAAAKRSSEVDPHSPHLRIVDFAGLYFYARRYDLAVEEFRRSIENDPGAVLPHLGLAEVYVQQQKFTEALAEARKAKALVRNPGQLTRLGGIFAAAGDTKEATEILVKTKDLSSKRVAYFIASIYAALGNNTEAIAWLTKAVDEFDTVVIDLKVDPRFDSLRQDARFTALLGRMKLVQ
jgi:tetratricopeptide (TPR) repeat protein